MLNEAKKAIIKFDVGVRNAGVVENIIICDENGLRGLTFPFGHTVWDCTNFEVGIGDRWKDGEFFEPDGITPCQPYISPEQEQINVLAKEKTALENQLTDAQMALCELYELTLV